MYTEFEEVISDVIFWVNEIRVRERERITLTNLGERILWARDTFERLLLFPLFVVPLMLFMGLRPFLPVTVFWIPGGFGAQFGFPWFGTTLFVVAIVDVAVVVVIFTVIEFVLLLLLLLFPYNVDLFGNIVKFAPFDVTVVGDPLFTSQNKQPIPISDIYKLTEWLNQIHWTKINPTKWRETKNKNEIKKYG